MDSPSRRKFVSEKRNDWNFLKSDGHQEPFFVRSASQPLGKNSQTTSVIGDHRSDFPSARSTDDVQGAHAPSSSHNKRINLCTNHLDNAGSHHRINSHPSISPPRRVNSTSRALLDMEMPSARLQLAIQNRVAVDTHAVGHTRVFPNHTQAGYYSNPKSTFDELRTSPSRGMSARLGRESSRVSLTSSPSSFGRRVLSVPSTARTVSTPGEDFLGGGPISPDGLVSAMYSARQQVGPPPGLSSLGNGSSPSLAASSPPTDIYTRTQSFVHPSYRVPHYSQTTYSYKDRQNVRNDSPSASPPGSPPQLSLAHAEPHPPSIAIAASAAAPSSPAYFSSSVAMLKPKAVAPRSTGALFVKKNPIDAQPTSPVNVPTPPSAERPKTATTRTPRSVQSAAVPSPIAFSHQTPGDSLTSRSQHRPTTAPLGGKPQKQAWSDQATAAGPTTTLVPKLKSVPSLPVSAISTHRPAPKHEQDEVVNEISAFEDRLFWAQQRESRQRS